MITTSLLLLATLAPPIGPVDLVADLGHNTPDFGYDFVFGTAWAELNGVVYFLFDDGIHGLEPWRSDGTALGTFLLRDVCPGSCSGAAWRFFGPVVMHAAAGRVFFLGDDGIHGPELWQSDGTALGTVMVRELVPGKGGIVISRMLEAAGQLFFLASEPGGTSAVWRSDGTAKGTFMFWDPVTHDAWPVSAIERGPGWLWVAAGGSLWRTDGTVQGSFEISPMSSPWYFNLARRNFGATSTEALFFTEAGLAASDGTPGGTATIDAGLGGSGGFSIDDDVVLYARSVDPMWERTVKRYSGGLVAPEDLGIEPPASAWSDGPMVQMPDDTVVAAVSEPSSGIELWAKPPTEPFALLGDINPGSASSVLPVPFGWYSGAWKRIGDRFVFLADDGIRGFELWVSDGTPAGTMPLPELVAGPGGVETGSLSRMRDLVELPGPLFFRHITEDGVKLARSDGTPTGTLNVRTIGTQTSVEGRFAWWDYGCRASVGRRLAVGILSQSGPPTALVALAAGEPVEELVAAEPGADAGLIACAYAGAKLLAFLPKTSGEAQLIVTDGTPGGTVELAEVPFGETVPVISRGEDVVWGADGAIWRSDGTAPGTVPLVPTAAGTPLAVNGGLVLFSEGVLRNSILEPLSPLSLSLQPVKLGGGFLALESGLGRWLWIDGEPAAATTIGILGGGREVPEDLLVLQQFNGTSPTLRFAATLDATRALLLIDDGKHGPELWVTDGSAAGSTLVADVRPGPRGSDPIELVQIREGLVAFVADDGIHGRELWVSDGTAAGTIQLDLLPGAASSRPERLTAIDGALLFSAWTPDFGREAWWSDGTLTGTGRISDIAPGPKSSSPERFARAGRRLYFLATDHVLGFEWWSLDVPTWAGLFADGFESGDFSAWSGFEAGAP